MLNTLIGLVFGGALGVLLTALLFYFRDAAIQPWHSAAPEEAGEEIPTPVAPSAELVTRVKAFGVLKPGVDIGECVCDHKIHGTGAVFFQSAGVLYCEICGGWQLIRKGVV